MHAKYELNIKTLNVPAVTSMANDGAYITIRLGLNPHPIFYSLSNFTMQEKTQMSEGQ